MKSRQYSIRQHVTWLTLVPLLVMAAVLESFFLHTQFVDMDHDLLARGLLIARQLAASSEYGVFSNNRSFLASVAKSTMQENDVQGVILLNATGTVMAASANMQARADSLSRMVGRETRVTENGSELLLYQPILATQVALGETDAEPPFQRIGTVIIEMSWQRTNSMKSRLLWLTVGATALFLLITLALVYLANRRIIASIDSMSQAVNLIGTGDFNTRVTVSSRISEIQALGNGINHMATELRNDRAILQEAHGKLDQANRNLELTVAERTRELTASLGVMQQQKLALQEHEAKLLASEQRYHSLFHDASDAIGIANEAGVIEEVNRSFALLFGYDNDELQGMSVERLHPATELPRIRLLFQETLCSAQPSPVQTIVMRKDGTPVEVEIRPTRIETAERKVVQGMFIDLSERRRQEQQRIDLERAHVNTLVREVHHRIKNNLQSVAGLLHRELGKYLELDPRLETAISQVNAIAVVHGLQGTNPNEAIRLHDSVQNICKTIADLSQRSVLFHVEPEDSALRLVEIMKDEAVPLALVVNELILNAVKHSPEGKPAPTVSLSVYEASARIVIRNAMAGVLDFDFASGKGIGTGLSLVNSLLPERGAHLAHEVDRDGFLVTILRLAYPAIATPRQKESS